jgi:hypothetical protein
MNRMPPLRSYLADTLGGCLLLAGGCGKKPESMNRLLPNPSF